MTVSARLILAFIALTAVLAAPTVYATLRLGELQTLAVGERDGHATASLAMGRIEAGFSRVDLQMRSYLVAPDPAEAARLDSMVEDLREQVFLLEASGYADAARSVGPVIEVLGAAIEEIQKLVDSGRLAEATEAFGTIQSLIEVGGRELTDGAVMVDRRAQTDFLRAQEISSSARTGTLLALVLALTTAVLVGAWATEVLASPLKRLSLATSDVADGDFRAPEDLPYERRDEIGELSRSFRSMTNRLLELDRMKAEFVGLATHDLKTPINVIRGYAELVDEELGGAVTGHQHEILEGISEQCHVMARLVSRLMDISRLEAGTYRLAMERIHLEDLVTGTLQALELLAEREGVHLVTRMEEDLPTRVIMDVDVVRHEILGNLISNAIKFTPEGGEVRLSVRRCGSHVVFRVTDTGPGIAPGHREHIFDKYYQVDRSQKVGAGLGLAIVRELTEAHGGRVELLPSFEAGVGAIFEVILPVEPAESAKPVDSTESTGDDAAEAVTLRVSVARHEPVGATGVRRSRRSGRARKTRAG